MSNYFVMKEYCHIGPAILINTGTIIAVTMRGLLRLTGALCVNGAITASV